MTMVKQKKILLVEDNDKDIELIQLVLTECKLAETVFVIQDGGQVMDYLLCKGKYINHKNGLPSLIILDVKMPKVDGLEVVQLIKRDAKLKYIPIVIFSTSAQTREISRCYELGANAYVVKPVDFNEFYNSIKNIGEFWLKVNTTSY